MCVCFSGLRHVMTLSLSDTHKAAEGKNEEDVKETAQGGKEGLFTVPYFLSQHPLSSRGKSIPKVKGHPGGIPFVPSAMPYMLNLVSMWRVLL